MKNDTSSDYTQPTKLQKLFVRLVKNRNNEIESYTIFKPAFLLNIEVNVEAIKYKNVEEEEEEDYDIKDIQKLQKELRDLQDDLEIDALSKKAFRERRREIRTLRRRKMKDDVDKLRSDVRIYEEREKQLQKINEKEEELNEAIKVRFLTIENKIQKLKNQKMRRTRFSQRRNSILNDDVDDKIQALEDEKEELENLNPKLIEALDADNFASDESDEDDSEDNEDNEDDDDDDDDNFNNEMAKYIKGRMQDDESKGGEKEEDDKMKVDDEEEDEETASEESDVEDEKMNVDKVVIDLT